MSRLSLVQHQKDQRKRRIRANISSTATVPRLSVYVSNTNITAQIIDDTTHKTLVYVSTINMRTLANETMTSKASKLGTELAKNASKVKISKVVFDRNGRRYHGRIKALAESARDGGLEF